MEEEKLEPTNIQLEEKDTVLYQVSKEGILYQFKEGYLLEVENNK